MSKQVPEAESAKPAEAHLQVEKTAWFCTICGEGWEQVDGSGPQRHKPGCPNAREGEAA